jgi:hypothetical protein
MKSAVFAPKLEALSEEENLELIKELYKKRVIVIPGYENAYEFTKDLNSKKLGKLVYDRFVDRYTTDRFIDYFDEIELQTENMSNLKNIVDMGINPIIIFEVDKENSSQRVGHSLLVTGYREDSVYIHLDVFDSNFGYMTNKNYRFNKKTSTLETPFYKAINLKLPGFDLSKEVAESNLVGDVNKRRLLKKTATIRKNYSFSLSDIYK